MVEIEFIYNAKKTSIQCQENEILKNIIKRYSTKIMKDVDKLFFLYNGFKINEEYSFKELANNLDKEKKKMIILVNDIESESFKNKDNIKKSKEIICPICRGNARIEFKDYKIKLYGCENNHIYEDIQLNEFNDLQSIDESQIICGNCKINNKSETFNKNFYICNDCKINLCPMCKSKHEKNHYIINYELKNYFCKFHNGQKYTSYCSTCNLNICLLCSEKHNKHNIIYYQNILPKKEGKIKEMIKLRVKIDDITVIIKDMINAFKKVIENIEIYYNIEMDILNNYNINNLNYEILQNIKDINNYKLNKDIDELIDYGESYINEIYWIYKQMKNFKKNENKNILKDKEKEEKELGKNKIKEIKIENKDEIIYKIGKYEYKVKIFGETFVDNNNDKIEIVYKNKIYKLRAYLYLEVEKEEEDNNLDYRLIKIELKGINNVINMNGMFYECSSLISLPDISKWNTNKVINMSVMFRYCRSLSSLPDISKWNTNNVTNMGEMFGGCSSLSSLPDISKWNTNNVTNIGEMFSGCSSLISLPDISKWNTNKVINMSVMFRYCRSLSSLPDISKWNTNNVINIGEMFSGCSSLSSLPDISKWNINNVTNMGEMFSGCSSLSSLPDISKWSTNKVTNMGEMFNGCSKLSSLPDISKWSTNKVTNMGEMFSGCSSLSSLPDISKWNLKNLKKYEEMFKGCSISLKILNFNGCLIF